MSEVEVVHLFRLVALMQTQANYLADEGCQGPFELVLQPRDLALFTTSDYLQVATTLGTVRVSARPLEAGRTA